MEKYASGVERLFKDVFYMLPQRDRAKLVNLMYNWGINDAEKVIKLLKTKRDLHGCAIALLAAQHVFGVKSRIAKES